MKTQMRRFEPGFYVMRNRITEALTLFTTLPYKLFRIRRFF
jgi:hypothetical protein